MAMDDDDHDDGDTSFIDFIPCMTLAVVFFVYVSPEPLVAVCLFLVVE